jgi:hypothetical protein
MVTRQFNLSSISIKASNNPFAAFTPTPSASGASPSSQAARDRRLSMLDPGPRRLSVIARNRKTSRIIPLWPGTGGIDAVRVFTQSTASCIGSDDGSGVEPDVKRIASSASYIPAFTAAPSSGGPPGVSRSESTGSTSSWIAWAATFRARKTMKVTRAWLRGKPGALDEVKDTLVHNLVTCELPPADDTQPRLHRSDSRALRFERLLAKLSSRDVCPLTIDESSPVSSLDQLHAQGCLLHGVLLDKAISLASLFGGMFPREGKPGLFVRWEGEESRPMCQFSEVKSVSRCIDKIDIAYGGDVSRLLDICRQMIVFDNIRDLSDCLAALLGDTTVEIVRIKNRMSPSMNNADPLFAGYRCVYVCVCVMFLCVCICILLWRLCASRRG